MSTITTTIELCFNNYDRPADDAWVQRRITEFIDRINQHAVDAEDVQLLDLIEFRETIQCHTCGRTVLADSAVAHDSDLYCSLCYNELTGDE